MIDKSPHPPLSVSIEQQAEFEERAAIWEVDGKMLRRDAEIEAMLQCKKRWEAGKTLLST